MDIIKAFGSTSLFILTTEFTLTVKTAMEFSVWYDNLRNYESLQTWPCSGVSSTISEGDEAAYITPSCSGISVRANCQQEGI